MDHVYKTTEVVGSSQTGIEDAVQTALTKAGETLHNMRWFEVGEVRGQITDDHNVHYWQVTIKIGFTVD